MKHLFYTAVLQKITRIGFVVFSFLLLFVFICNCWVIYSTKSKIYSSADEIPFNEVGIVPGVSKYIGAGRYINPYFHYRLVAAAELYHKGKIKYILVTGDNHNKNYDEPGDMKNYLIALGVPAACITCDYAGFRTFDSMVRAKKVFGLKRFTVISQRFHNERALFICNQYGINAIAFSAKDPYISTGLRVREYLAKTKAVLDLYVLFTEPRFLGNSESVSACISE